MDRGRASTKKLLVFGLVALMPMCAPQGREVEDIREATFRHLFENWGHAQAPPVYCLSVEGRDPTDDFMHRFVNNEFPVVKRSLCSALKGPIAYIETATGRHAVVFWIGKVTPKWGPSAEVEGSYGEHGFNAGYHNYFLEKADGAWKVVKQVQIGPSV